MYIDFTSAEQRRQVLRMAIAKELKQQLQQRCEHYTTVILPNGECHCKDCDDTFMPCDL